MVELVNKKEFAKAILGKNIKTFVLYVSSLELKIKIHLAKKVQIVLLLAEEIIVPAE